MGSGHGSNAERVWNTDESVMSGSWGGIDIPGTRDDSSRSETSW